MKVVLEMTELEAEEAVEKGLILPLLKLFKKDAIPAGFEPADAAPVWEAGGNEEMERSMARPVDEKPAAPVATTVPTDSREYTIDEITKAAIGLMDNGKQADLQTLLQNHGIQALPSLPKSDYGKFALDLRSLGAEI